MNTIFEHAVEVSSIFSLIAFLSAIGLFAYFRKLKAQEKLLQLSPEGERGDLVEAMLGHFNIDTSDLTKRQKYELVIHQVNAKSKKFRTFSILATLITLICALTLVFVIKNQNGSIDRPPELIQERSSVQ